MRRTITAVAGLALSAAIGLSVGQASESVAHGHRVDIPFWVVRPCPHAHSVNCRQEGAHPNVRRELDGNVCVYFAQRDYARTHDYCTNGE